MAYIRPDEKSTTGTIKKTEEKKDKLEKTSVNPIRSNLFTNMKGLL